MSFVSSEHDAVVVSCGNDEVHNDHILYYQARGVITADIDLSKKCHFLTSWLQLIENETCVYLDKDNFNFKLFSFEPCHLFYTMSFPINYPKGPNQGLPDFLGPENTRKRGP